MDSLDKLEAETAQKEIILIKVSEKYGHHTLYRDEEKNHNYIITFKGFGRAHLNRCDISGAYLGPETIETPEKVFRITIPSGDSQHDVYLRRWLISQYLPKSDQQIEDLKADWLNDPCYDLEETPGFEHHYLELKNFSELSKKNWELQRNREINAKAHELGIPGNKDLARYIMMLEDRLEKLEGIINA